MFRCGRYDGRVSKPLSLQQMTSSAPMDKADGTPEEDQSPEKGVPVAAEPWWRPWLGPAVAATIISALVIALVTVGVTGFNSLKGDITSLKGDIADLKLDIRASEIRLREDMKELRAETRENMKEFRADNRALNDKLDRLLEIVLMDKS